MRLAVYPGSFDPITNGHLDVRYSTRSSFYWPSIPTKKPLSPWMSGSAS